MSHLDQPLRILLELKLHELLEHYGRGRWNPERISEQTTYVCCVLGFHGERVQGSVILAATLEAIADTSPTTDGVSREWIAELTNQLVGRYKNELLRFGVEISIGQPVVLTATRITPLPERHLDPIVMGIGEGIVSAWLDIRYPSDLSLAPRENDAVPVEGATLLF